MSLSQKELDYLLEQAKKAALAAGKIIQNFNREQLKIETKIAGENIASQVVTQVDFECQEKILDILNPTIEKYNLGLLTEESIDDNSRFVKNYFWCIDPLDGTLAFSKNQKGYSVSIALVSKEGIPILGVVFEPRTENLYWAIKSYGAFKNGSLLKKAANNNLTLFYDKSYLESPNFKMHIKTIESLIQKTSLLSVQHNPQGGAVMNGINTIEYAPALYFKQPKRNTGGGSLWDFAASSIIQAEAGGFNSSYSFEKINLNKSQNTFMNDKGIIYSTLDEELLKSIIYSL